MKKKEYLFHLIKSLTKSEKRYFKVYAAKHIIGTQNNYVRLFEAIDSQEGYDEAALRAAFEGEDFLQNLSETKYYLYKALLRSLHLCHLENDVDARLNEMIHEAQILERKGLYYQAKEIFSKAKQIALHNRRSYTLEIILSGELRLLHNTVRTSELEDTMLRLNTELNDLQTHIRNEHAFKQLYNQIWFFTRRIGVIRSAEHREKLERLRNHALLRDEANALTTRGRMFFHHFFIVYYSHTSNPDMAFEHCKRATELIDDVMLDDDHEFSAAFVTLESYCASSLESGRIAEFEKTFKIISDLYERRMREDPQHSQLPRIFAGLHMRLLCDNCTGNFESGIEYVAKLSKGLRTMTGKLGSGDGAVFYCLFSCACFGAADYPNALAWINRVFEVAEKDVREDIHRFARIFALLIHYKQGNFKLLPHMLKSATRFFDKLDGEFRFERTAIAYLRKLISKSGQRSPSEIFKQWEQTLYELREDPAERRALDYIDLISWVKSQRLGVEFGAVIREKFIDCNDNQIDQGATTDTAAPRARQDTAHIEPTMEHVTPDDVFAIENVSN